MVTKNAWDTKYPAEVPDGCTAIQTTTAYGTLCGGTTSTGPIQNAGTGTSSQALTANGSSSLPTWQAFTGGLFSVVTQVFTTNGTYTPTSGMQYCIVELVGGGGGSGGLPNTPVGWVSCMGGGGAGGYSRKTIDAATVGASQAITVGSGGAGGTPGSTTGSTGGTTSFGAIFSATGGAGSTGSGISMQTTASAGGLGGLGSGGDINTRGGCGEFSLAWVWLHPNGNDYSAAHPGIGGQTFFGGSSITSGGGVSFPGRSYGAGGAGSSTSVTAPVAGAAGFAGICIITEFVFA
jgi:hypothetical protein